MPASKSCTRCGELLEYVNYSPEPVCLFCEDDFNSGYNNGPTGHGDECFSDADPAL